MKESEINNMTQREKLGQQIKAIRKEKGLSIYSLEEKGLRRRTGALIERSMANYTIDRLIDYIERIGGVEINITIKKD